MVDLDFISDLAANPDDMTMLRGAGPALAQAILSGQVESIAQFCNGIASLPRDRGSFRDGYLVALEDVSVGVVSARKDANYVGRYLAALNGIQKAILRFVGRHQAKRASEIAQGVGKTARDVSPQLNRLVDAQLLDCWRSPTDGRIRVYGLTEIGQDVYEQIPISDEIAPTETISDEIAPKETKKDIRKITRKGSQGAAREALAGLSRLPLAA